MAGLGTPATTSIITGGLDCTPACIGLITSRFSLYCTEVPPEPPGEAGGGGPYPGPAWNQQSNINKFYQPVEEQPFVIPQDQEADYFRKYVNVVVNINMGNINVEKIYRVPEQRRKAVITVFSLVNATRERMAATITNLKGIATRATAIIKNLRVRRRK